MIKQPHPLNPELQVGEHTYKLQKFAFTKGHIAESEKGGLQRPTWVQVVKKAVVVAEDVKPEVGRKL